MPIRNKLVDYPSRLVESSLGLTQRHHHLRRQAAITVMISRVVC